MKGRKYEEDNYTDFSICYAVQLCFLQYRTCGNINSSRYNRDYNNSYGHKNTCGVLSELYKLCAFRP